MSTLKLRLTRAWTHPNRWKTLTILICIFCFIAGTALITLDLTRSNREPPTIDIGFKGYCGGRITAYAMRSSAESMQVAVLWGEQPIADMLRSPDLFTTYQTIDATSRPHAKTNTSIESKQNSGSSEKEFDQMVERMQKDEPIHWKPKNPKQGDCNGTGLIFNTTENLKISVDGVFIKPKTYICDLKDKGCIDYIRVANEIRASNYSKGVSFDNGAMYKAADVTSTFTKSKNHYEYMNADQNSYEILQTSSVFSDKGRNSVYGFLITLNGSRQNLGASTLGLQIKIGTHAKGLYVADFFDTKEEQERQTREIDEQRPAASIAQVVAISDSRFVASEWAQDRTRNRVKKNIWFAEEKNYVADAYLWEDVDFERNKAIRDMIGSILIGFAFALICELLIASAKEQAYKNAGTGN